MDFIDIVKLAISNGIGIACIVYFMFRDYKFMDTLNKTLVSLNESVSLIEKYFLEERNSRKDGKEDDLR